MTRVRVGLAAWVAFLSGCEACTRRPCAPGDTVLQGSVSVVNGRVSHNELSLGPDTGLPLRDCKTVTGHVYVDGVVNTARVFEDMEDVQGGINLFDVENDGSKEFFPSLKTTPSVYWLGRTPDGEYISPPILTAFNQLVEAGSVDMTGLMTTELHIFDKLRRVGSFRVEPVVLEVRMSGLGELEYAGSLSTKVGNPLTKLREVEGDMELGVPRPLENARRLDLPALKRVGGDIRVGALAEVTLHAPVLESVQDLGFVMEFSEIEIPMVTRTKSFTLQNSNLTSMQAFENLAAIDGPATIINNLGIPQSEIDAWLIGVTVSGSVFTSDNGGG